MWQLTDCTVSERIFEEYTDFNIRLLPMFPVNTRDTLLAYLTSRGVRIQLIF